MTAMKKGNHKVHKEGTKHAKVIVGALRAPSLPFVSLVSSFVPFVFPLLQKGNHKDHKGGTKHTKAIFGALRAPTLLFVPFVSFFVPLVLPLFPSTER